TKMNKLSKLVLGVAVSAMLLSGCKNQEVVAPTVTNPNQFPNGVVQKRVTVSLQVIASTEIGRTEGLTGASVTIAQNGSTSTKSTDKDGIVVFTDLYPGDYKYYVSASGFASVNGSGSASDQSNALTGTTGNNTNQTVQSSNAVPTITLPKIGAKVVGRFLIDSDGDATTAGVPAANYRVRLTFDNSFQPNTYYTTTGSDGSYTFPSVLDGKSATISVDTVLTVGVEVKKVSYSSNITPKFGNGVSDGTQLLTLDGSATTGIVIKSTGTVKGKLWGNFTKNSAGTAFKSDTVNFSTSITGATSAVLTLEGKSGNAAKFQYFQTKRNATTLSAGEFTFTNLPSGTYDLTATVVIPLIINKGTPLEYVQEQTLTYTNTGLSVADDQIVYIGIQKIQ
ncbi:MAG: carboxypeptidase-like regulatory domain-containing protein, partial [Cytophagales bacterium]|nr:carboxypeptidase-like regulatory domain-containing protein [Cytophagales bacterium]